MVEEARFSQYSTIVVGDAPPDQTLAPDPVVGASALPSVSVPQFPSPSPLIAAWVLPDVNVLIGTQPNPSPLAATALLLDVTVEIGEPPDETIVCDSPLQPQYLSLLQSLLPWGRAWTRQAGSTLTRLLEGFACEFATIEDRARQLLIETDPRTSSELLSDWERAMGLPDPCTGPLPTEQQRRAAVVSRLAEVGGQSPQYYIDLAASLGFDVTIIEFDPFQVDVSTVEQALTNQELPFEVDRSTVEMALWDFPDWLFTWAVVSPDFTIQTFQVDRSTVGEALETWGNGLLECVLQRVKPAHTLLVFYYEMTLHPDPTLASLSVPVVTTS